MLIDLRDWRLEDADSLARYASNPNIAANLRDAFPHPYTHQDAVAYISSCLEGDPALQLTRAITADGEAMGSIGAFLGSDVYRKSAEIGYWLAEPFWGRGIMTKAVLRICREAFDTFAIVRLYAEPFARNMGSRRVLEKAGFRLEGILRQSVYKQDQILDSCLYAMTLSDFQCYERIGKP